MQDSNIIEKSIDKIKEIMEKNEILLNEKKETRQTTSQFIVFDEFGYYNPSDENKEEK
jgi:hypothetical protein